MNPEDDFFDFMIFDELLGPLGKKPGRKGKGITKEEAMTIFFKKKGGDIRSWNIWDVTEKLPKNRHVYNASEDSWFIIYQKSDGVSALRSSLVMAIDKKTGKIRYDGSLNDEG